MHRRMKGMNEGPEGGQMQNEKPVSHIRPGLRMITPYLVAENGIALIDFVKSAFGAEELFRAEMPTGVHGEVRIGDSTLMMGGGIPGKKFPGTLQAAALHVYVEDVDAVTEKALAAGATLIDQVAIRNMGSALLRSKMPVETSGTL